jgi:hypothetical protein
MLGGDVELVVMMWHATCRIDLNFHVAVKVF